MKCISLWQPWATLVVIGAKIYETRHWATNYRGPMGIHAAQIKRSRRDNFDVEEVFERPAFKLALQAAGYRDAKDLAYGALIGRVNLDACLMVVPRSRLSGGTSSPTTMYAPSPPECEFGNFEPGRYGWSLSGQHRLAQPILMTGRQGFWEIDDKILRSAA